jgi:hypothetical protein
MCITDWYTVYLGTSAHGDPPPSLNWQRTCNKIRDHGPVIKFRRGIIGGGTEGSWASCPPPSAARGQHPSKKNSKKAGRDSWPHSIRACDNECGKITHNRSAGRSDSSGRKSSTAKAKSTNGKAKSTNAKGELPRGTRIKTSPAPRPAHKGKGETPRERVKMPTGGGGGEGINSNSGLHFLVRDLLWEEMRRRGHIRLTGICS